MDLIPLLTAMGLATRHLGRRRHLLDDLLRAVSRRPRVRDPRPHGRRPRRLERGDVAQRLRGGQLRPGEPSRARRPLRSRRRVHGGGARPLGHAGRTTRSSSTASAASSPIPRKVHRLDHEGKWFRSRGPFTVPRTPQGRPVHHPGRSERAGPALRRALGRADFRDLPERSSWAGAVYREFKDEVAQTRARSRIRCAIAPAIYVHRRRDAGHGGGQGRVHRQARPSARQPRPAVRGAQLRLRDARAWTSRSADQELASISGLQAIRDRVVARQRQGEPDRPRLHRAQRPRDAPRDAAYSWARRTTSPTGSRSGSPAGPATDSSLRRRTCPARTRTSCGWWCRSCSGAGCFTASTRGGRCARASGSRGPVAARGASSVPSRAWRSNRSSAGFAGATSSGRLGGGRRGPLRSFSADAAGSRRQDLARSSWLSSNRGE